MNASELIHLARNHAGKSVMAQESVSMAITRYAQNRVMSARGWALKSLEQSVGKEHPDYQHAHKAIFHSRKPHQWQK